MLVTCGDQADPRIRLGVDVAQALTFIFRSDGNNPLFTGVNITMIEINATAADVSDNVHLVVTCNIHYECIVLVIQWCG